MCIYVYNMRSSLRLVYSKWKVLNFKPFWKSWKKITFNLITVIIKLFFLKWYLISSSKHKWNCKPKAGKTSQGGSLFSQKSKPEPDTFCNECNNNSIREKVMLNCLIQFILLKVELFSDLEFRNTNILNFDIEISSLTSPKNCPFSIYVS